MGHLLLISSLALSLKLLVIWHSRRVIPLVSAYVLAIFSSFLIMNVCELLGFYSAHNGGTNGLPLLVIYYLSAIASTFAMLALALENTGLSPRWWAYPVLIGFLVTIFATIIPGAAISGIENIGYSITRVPGPYYWVIQIGLVVPILLCTLVLLHTAVRSRHHKQSALANIYLAAYFPVALTAVGVVLLMALGVKINASGFMSLAVCISLWILLYTTTRRNQFLFMAYLPHTREHRFIQRISNHMMSLTTGNMDQAVHALEARIIEEALTMTDGDKNQAAQILGLEERVLEEKLQAAAKAGYGMSM